MFRNYANEVLKFVLAKQKEASSLLLLITTANYHDFVYITSYSFPKVI